LHDLIEAANELELLDAVKFRDGVDARGEGGLTRMNSGKCLECVKLVPRQCRTFQRQYVDRSNLSMRMRMRRFTRLTNGFSKKLENHGHMVAL
jgi:hypothetical protein